MYIDYLRSTGFIGTWTATVWWASNLATVALAKAFFRASNISRSPKRSAKQSALFGTRSLKEDVSWELNKTKIVIYKYYIIFTIFVMDFSW